jgi:hypothetical protein
VRGVVLEQVRVGLRVAQVVDGDELQACFFWLSWKARRMLRPMRPKPLMATLMVI